MKKTPLLAVLAMGSLASGTAYAEGGFSEITWVPQIGFQMKNLEFDQKLRAETRAESGEGSLDVTMPTFSASLTGVYKKFYMTVKYEGGLGDASDFSDVPNTDAETKADRTDYTVTIGYNIYKNLNVFAGYMDGETTLKPEPLCPAFPNPGGGLPSQPDCGGGATSVIRGDGNNAHDNRILGLSNYEQTYQEDGWYVGVSYGWQFTDLGSLTVSAAYADLTATYKDNWLEGSPEFSNGPLAYDFEGDSNGLSVGINWSAPLSEHVGYYVDLRTQQYDMSASQEFLGRQDDPASGNEGPNFRQTRSVDTEETITALTAGIQWYF